jgi:predicted small lipoprotein YifL
MTRVAVFVLVLAAFGLGLAACGKKSDLEPPQRFHHDALA